MFSRVAKLAACAVATAIAVASGAGAAGPPPPPTSTNGNPVQLVASGLMTPTSFAFGDGTVFEGDGGSTSSKGPPNGGIYVLKDGTATKLAGSPAFVGGLAWRGSTLYVSGGNVSGTGATFQLLAWSGWNGTTFTKKKVIYTAPKKFEGFNGLGFGANGRLYVGADVGLLNNNDHGPASKSPYVYDILSINPNGTGFKVFATGIRQPWQMVFPKGSSSPFVTDFGQDSGAKNPPDFILRVKQGQDYGFPKCNWTKAAACKGYAKPFKMLPPHTDVGGIAMVGSELYMSEFGFAKPNVPLVVSLPASGKGTPKPLLKGFVAPVIGLATNGGYLYVGELTGQVFRVKL
jgi:glucose/arabinose dehydrogenase